MTRTFVSDHVIINFQSNFFVLYTYMYLLYQSFFLYSTTTNFVFSCWNCPDREENLLLHRKSISNPLIVGLAKLSFRSWFSRTRILAGHFIFHGYNSPFRVFLLHIVYLSNFWSSRLPWPWPFYGRIAFSRAMVTLLIKILRLTPFSCAIFGL